MPTPRLAPAFRTCGVRIDVVGPRDAADAVIELARSATPSSVHLCNAYTLALCRDDPALAGTIDGGTLNLMDGMPLVWTARRLGFDVDGRAYGPDLMLEVMERGAGLHHYLYGSTPEVIAALQRRLHERVPGVQIVGAESPPFRELTSEEESALVERLRASGAHVVWVGLGTPKQDRFVERFRGSAPAVFVAVGAAFDFHAGVKKQAPAWMQDRGLEWLYRLATEPRRLWRRYLVGNVVFLRGLLAGVSVVRTSGGEASRQLP